MRGILLLAALMTAPIVALAADAKPTPARQVFLTNCVMCHGYDATGNTGEDFAGANLVTSKFIHDRTDDELLAFLRVGRDANDRDNKMRFPMPAFDYLSEDDLKLAVQYLRSVNR